MSTRNHRIYDQQLLNLYINMYERTMNKIDLLYDDLSEIRENINAITGVSGRNRTSNNNNNRETAGHSTSIPTTPLARSNSIGGNNNNLSTWFHQLGNRRGDGTVNNLFTPNIFPNNFFDRVPVSPSQQQIENATSIVRFSEIETPPYANCPITLDAFDVNSNVTQILHCGHIFDIVAIQSWFREHTHCPVCRYDVRNYVRHVIVNQESPRPLSAEEETTPVPRETPSPRPIPQVNSNETADNQRRERAQLLQNMVDNLPLNDEEILNTFTNMTSNILNNFFTNTLGENPISLDNSNYHIDASNNLIFESHLRNNFR